MTEKWVTLNTEKLLFHLLLGVICSIGYLKSALSLTKDVIRNTSFKHFMSVFLMLKLRIVQTVYGPHVKIYLFDNVGCNIASQLHVTTKDHYVNQSP